MKETIKQDATICEDIFFFLPREAGGSSLVLVLYKSNAGTLTGEHNL